MDFSHKLLHVPITALVVWQEAFPDIAKKGVDVKTITPQPRICCGFVNLLCVYQKAGSTNPLEFIEIFSTHMWEEKIIARIQAITALPDWKENGDNDSPSERKKRLEEAKTCICEILELL